MTSTDFIMGLYITLFVVGLSVCSAIFGYDAGQKMILYECATTHEINFPIFDKKITCEVVKK